MTQRQGGDGDPQLHGIETGLARDFPALDRRLARSGRWFVTMRLAVGLAALLLAVFVAAQADRWGIATVYFAVVLFIMGATEVGRRALQLYSLARDCKRG